MSLSSGWLCKGAVRDLNPEVEPTGLAILRNTRLCDPAALRATEGPVMKAAVRDKGLRRSRRTPQPPCWPVVAECGQQRCASTGGGAPEHRQADGDGHEGEKKHAEALWKRLSLAIPSRSLPTHGLPNGGSGSGSGSGMRCWLYSHHWSSISKPTLFPEIATGLSLPTASVGVRT